MISLHRAAVRRVEVSGESMAPALLPGDRLLVAPPALGLRRLRRGDLVALHDPRLPSRVVVKRVAALPGESVTCEGVVLAAGTGLVVLGDNLPASTDSRVFGPVPRRLVLGRCLLRYSPEARRGRL